jgi:hypothetical protein
VKRQRSTPEPRSHAKHAAATPDRLTAVETAIRDVQKLIDLQFKRIAAIQAQLDHIAARLDVR